MARKIFYSNQTEALVKELSAQINSSTGSVFAKDCIITQTTGMKQWVAVEMAKKENNGVFSNFKMLSQDAFLNEIYELLFNRKIENNAETSKWLLFRLLGSPEFRESEGSAIVNSYCFNNDLKRIQLATRLAALFDQYQINSEGLIQKWNAGIVTNGSENEKWQKWLWTNLSKDKHYFPRFRIKEDILAAIENAENKKKIQARFPVINFFGNSVYSKYHIEIYDSLATIDDIRINHFILFPAGKIVSKEECRNELLENLGGGYFELADILNFNDATSLGKTPGGRLLNMVQEQIFSNIPPQKSKTDCLHDNSVQINSAYTEAREVEMLFNYLVDLKSNDKDLKPQDILVLTTDIDKYAPYIKAVFNNATFYNIPYRISGVSCGQKETIITALVKILDFEEDLFTSEKVISLLETKPIASRFCINSISYIRNKIEKANIRFGIQAIADKDETLYVSWKYGLEKLALGYAMMTDKPYRLSEEQEECYPFSDLGGKEGLDIFRLKAFTDELEYLLAEKKQRKTLKEWRTFTEGILDKMILVEFSDKAEQAVIFNKLSVQKDAEEETDEQVEFKVFYSGLRAALLEEPGKSGLNSGKVTFSSHFPARGIPAKVIAFLGMNNNQFPRKDLREGFDLTGEEAPVSKKEIDKMLFLEVLMSARDNVYFSYLGRDARDNSPIPPSIVLDQFMDYLELIAGKRENVRKGLLREHPLHGFSQKYKKADSRMFSFLYSEGKTNTFNQKEVSEEKNDEIEVNIRRITKFLEDPIEWYYQKVMGINFDDNTGPISETELFDLDNLQKWKIGVDIMEFKGDKDEERALIKKLKMEGKIQLAGFGDLEFREKIESTEDLKKSYLDLTGTKTRSRKFISIPVEIESAAGKQRRVNIVGSVDYFFESNELISYSLSKEFKHRHETRSRMNHLFLNASGHHVKTITLKLGCQTPFTLEILASDIALQKIKTAASMLLDSYDRIFLFVECASKKITELKKAGSPEESRKLMDELAKLIRKESFKEPVNQYFKQAFDDGLFSEPEKLIADTSEIKELLAF